MNYLTKRKLEKIKRKPNQWLENEFKEEGQCCYYCKQTIDYDSITRDHIVPKVKGGHLYRANWVFACHPCNVAKGNLTLTQFADLCVAGACKYLRRIVKRKFKATKFELDKIDYFHRVMKSCNELILAKSIAI